ncbi:MAG: hypothetical protein HY897_06025 [Deltaproteobacteria bacterium]|nr:hypothetical protein [Deltaproteobacteria bacterium]
MGRLLRAELLASPAVQGIEVDVHGDRRLALLQRSLQRPLPLCLLVARVLNDPTLIEAVIGEQR